MDRLSQDKNDRRRYRLGIDVGGTFTDLVLVDSSTGELRLGKTLTTALDPSEGVLAGVAELVRTSHVEPGAIDQVIHGTTLIGNAIIQRKGCRCVLITTRGFRDVLSFGREFRYDIYDSNLTFPKSLVARRDRLEVQERVGAAGQIIVDLTDAEMDRVLAAIELGAYEAAAISFLNSYRNGIHEQRMAKAIQSAMPDLPVSISSQILPQLGEFERTSVTVMNAFVQPLAGRYIGRLVDGLRAIGIAADLFCMSSNGGLLTAPTAAQYPIYLAESGPVAGALGAAHYGFAGQIANLLAFDMGGTTAKACFIPHGSPSITDEFEVARVQRLTKGSGMPIRLPAVDMLEIGTGGGSIAHINELGLMTVGPDSAGADPGPACYGHGGLAPTVTDANLLLGYLNPNFFLGGEMQLDTSAAVTAITTLCARSGLTADRAAWGIHEIVSQSMASAIRTHAIEKGVDYRDCVLLAFGGAGPIHAYRVASILGIPTVAFPWGAGVFSAFGLLTAPLRFELARTRPVSLTQLNDGEISATYREIEAQLVNLLKQAGLGPDQIDLKRSAGVRYAGQGVELRVGEGRDLDTPEDLREAFLASYEHRYGWTLANAEIEMLNWRCVASGPVPFLPPIQMNGHDSLLSPTSSRSVYISDTGGFTPTAVYSRYALRPSSEVHGPALIEERECTIFVGPDAIARVDGTSSLVMTLKSSHD